MRFYEFNEAAPEGDTFAIKVFKAMQAAEEERAAQLRGASGQQPVNGQAGATPGSTPGSTPAGTPGQPIPYTPAKGAINPNEIRSYLASKGFDNNQIAGWLVNIKWESGFKPGAYIASDAGQGQSGGFFGFHDRVSGDPKGLFTRMVAFTGGGNKWQTDWQGQLDFALQDPRGQQYKAMRFNTPGNAAYWWVEHYEKPKNTDQQAAVRAKAASQFA